MRWIGWPLIRAAWAFALAACSSHGVTPREPYDECIVEARHCPASTDGCSEVRVEYPEGDVVRAFCTSVCESDADCPADSRGNPGVCERFVGSAIAVCFEGCATDADCAPHFGCIDRLMDADGRTQFFRAPVCLPR